MQHKISEKISAESSFTKAMFTRDWFPGSTVESWKVHRGLVIRTVYLSYPNPWLKENKATLSEHPGLIWSFPAAYGNWLRPTKEIQEVNQVNNLKFFCTLVTQTFRLLSTPLAISLTCSLRVSFQVMLGPARKRYRAAIVEICAV